MSRKRPHADSSIVVCPKCHAEIGAPCVTFGTLSGDEPWSGPFGGVHRSRQHLADETLPVLPKPAKTTPRTTTCTCTNHLGTPKIRHKSRASALAWAARSKQVRGMRLEPYRCPTSDAWHIRTARTAYTVGPPMVRQAMKDAGIPTTNGEVR